MKRSWRKLPGPDGTLSPAVKAVPMNTDDGRRLSLIQAAYEVIAEQGFEGLRTRTVADRVGVNIATLHYYFPTKEALIGGLAEYLSFQFETVHAPAVLPDRSPALNRLHQEFADARYYRLERPDMLTVMQELTLRAQRDPAIKAIVAPLMYHWRAGLQQMIENGMRDGVFRPDLVPVVAAAFVASAIWGAMNVGVGIETVDGVFDEIERWLLKAYRQGGKSNETVNPALISGSPRTPAASNPAPGNQLR
jgi:TetR/AcrR family transcriptional regulator, regulator of cefoperazone and chloramphenicol sensitivity